MSAPLTEQAGQENRVHGASSGTADVLRVLVLAAARGADDPLAKACNVRHKCLLPVAGEPMLRRVVRALQALPQPVEITIVIDDETAARQALEELAQEVRFAAAAESASASALGVLQEMFAQAPDTPVLVTTGDHALLTPQMVQALLDARRRLPRADLLVGLASRPVVEAAFAGVRRTWMRFGPDEVTGCNLFLLTNEQALAAVRFWRQVERDRKRPWRIARAFGIVPLLRVLLGRVNLQQAFALASRRLGLEARPVLLKDARAAVDVDKPEDLALVERILAADEHRLPERESARG